VPGYPERDLPFDEPLDTGEGWAKFNRHYWLRDYAGFLEFFFSRCFTEPHSTKQIEDCVGWGLETTPETLALTVTAAGIADREEARALCARVRCPVLVLHGDEDAVRPPATGAALAEATGGELALMGGAGHMPHARHPVPVNGLLRELAESVARRQPRPSRFTRSLARPKRALFVSSPIGLGHARRDVAIAGELRRLVPDLEVHWLAQHPVTAVLEAECERIHPASAALASESAHFRRESGEHELHCFEAWRRMDEILLANFMVFHDVVREERYDVWIGDEAWELDYYLHENPELKTAAYVWLTDFVGWLPLPEGGEREARLTADYNAEMIEHVERYPRIRDRALFLGDPDDVVPHAFGPALPPIREWTEEHYAFVGYELGFDAGALPDRETLRGELGYGPHEQVCVVSVGGSGVGNALLRRAIETFPLARELVPRLRMVVVAGPRIDPAALPQTEGLEARPYVHDLFLHLAACDLALVQGGLATTMELTACKRPFLSFPLRRHFEQRVHVRHRLDRYEAGRCLELGESPPEALARAIAEELERPCRSKDVEPGAARRAAALIAELL
jgi:predicted glycosyltransferase